jgi:uroporphyrinogen decarboxylase
MAKLTSKQRVMIALSHKEADRTPLDIGAINNTTMHVSIEKKLCEYLGFEYQSSEIKAWDQQVVIPSEKILKYFGADARSIYIGEAFAWQEQSDGTFIDQWGIGRKASPDNLYYTMCHHPLSKATSLSELDDYEWPDPFSEERLLGLERRARELGREYCLVLEGFREANFGLASWLRGMVEFYMDLAGNQVFAHALLDRLLDWQLKLAGFVLDRIGQYVDIVKFADDLGTQESLLISPAMYREFIKPRQARLYQLVKDKCECPILLHSCGAIRDIIPDLIEIGVDALNPIQLSASRMDARSLKKEFGDRITFWGGGIDTQKTLPYGTPEEVRQEVRQNMETLKPGGGFVFAQVHNIQPEVPVENIMAMYEAYREYASY